MKILFVFATSQEADVLNSFSREYSRKSELISGNAVLSFIITGVGGISTAWTMQKWLSGNASPDLVINAGIAGSFNDKYKPGAVVMPVSDCFADLGVEKEGRYLTLGEAGFMDPNEYPFKNGLIYCNNEYVTRLSEFIQGVNAVTVNTVSGTESSIERLKKKFNPDIETMEGATFFYICARENIPFLALRAISNMVGADRKTGWEITLALENLAGKMEEILNVLK